MKIKHIITQKRSLLAKLLKVGYRKLTVGIVIIALATTGVLAASKTVFNSNKATADQVDRQESEVLGTGDVEDKTEENLIPTQTPEVLPKNTHQTTPTINSIPQSTQTNPLSQTDSLKPTACLEIKSDFHYKDNIYYSGKRITLDGSCSKNVANFYWYCDGYLAKTPQSIGIVFNLPFTGCNHPTTEITLLVTSSSGLTDKASRIIKLRVIPEPTICFHPSSSERKIINFNEEVTFDASCTQFLDENPVTRFVWEFRDGDLDNPITKEGAIVKHSFTKFAKTFSGSECPYGRGFEIGLRVETKLGGGSTYVHHYCPAETDPVIINLQNCIRDSGGQKNIDQCIAELNL